jgi:hypothetical protein
VRRSQPLIERGVVVVVVVRKLVRIGPVDLAVRRQVVPGVGIAGAARIGVGEGDEPFPVGARQASLPLRDRRYVRHRAVYRADALAQEIVAGGIDGELEVAVLAPFSRARFKRGYDLIDGQDGDLSPHLVPPRQSQPHRDDGAEQPVAADSQPEEFRVLLTRAAAQVAVGINESEADDIGDDRRAVQDPAVHVRRQRPAQGEAVGAGLLLDDCPGLRRVRLGGVQPVDQGWPHHPGGRLDLAAHGVEVDDFGQSGHVEQVGTGGELLAAHGVASPGDGQRATGCRTHHGAHVIDARRAQNMVHPGGIEPGMDIIDGRTGLRHHGTPGKWRAWGSPRGHDRACPPG